jgi:hypothetical protein
MTHNWLRARRCSRLPFSVGCVFWFHRDSGLSGCSGKGCVPRGVCLPAGDGRVTRENPRISYFPLRLSRASDSLSSEKFPQWRVSTHHKCTQVSCNLTNSLWNCAFNGWMSVLVASFMFVSAWSRTQKWWMLDSGMSFLSARLVASCTQRPCPGFSVVDCGVHACIATPELEGIKGMFSHRPPSRCPIELMRLTAQYVGIAHAIRTEKTRTEDTNYIT